MITDHAQYIIKIIMNIRQVPPEFAVQTGVIVVCVGNALQ